MNFVFSGVQHPWVIWVLSEFPEFSPVQMLVLLLISLTPAALVSNFEDYCSTFF